MSPTADHNTVSKPQDSQVHEKMPESLGPALYARVIDHDTSNGLQYEIEVVARTTGPSDNGDFERLAACVLLVNVQKQLKTGRILIDGKIEALWLKDEGAVNRLGSVQMLATLLAYVQRFCAEHSDIAHLSCIQTTDQPSWMKQFFTVAGFNLCEHLKPEAESTSWRICLQLNPIALVKEQTPGQLAPKITSAVDEVAPKMNGSISAPASDQGSELKIRGSQDRESVGKGGMMSATIPGLPKPPNDDRAEDWLSENKRILTSKPALPPTSPKAQTLKPFAAESSSDPALKKTATNDLDAAERKRKRAATTFPESGEGEPDRRFVRSRFDQKVPEANSTRTANGDDSQQPKAGVQRAMSQNPHRRHSIRMKDDLAEKLRTIQQEKTSVTELLAKMNSSRRTSASDPQPIKKEQTSASIPSRPASPRAPTEPYHSKTPYGKALTCYYWHNQGFCTKSDDECTYAHHETGTVARPPGAMKNGSRYRAPYGGYDGAGIW